jgi:hypothetical protein
MTDLVAISIAERGSFVAFAFTHSYSLYGMNPLALKVRRDFIHDRLTSVSKNADGVQTAESFEPLTSDPQSHFKVSIWNNFYSDSDVDLTFTDPVRELVLRGSVLIVVLPTSVCLYDLTRMAVLFEQLTAANVHGCGDLSFDEATPKIAICGLVPGSVQICSMNAEVRPVFFQAHLHTLTIIRFSPNSGLVATASEQGTLIRVFDAATGALIGVFRRGALKSEVLAIAISPGNQKLIAISGNGTVHAFRLSDRIVDDERAPRAVSKLKLGIFTAVDVVFKSEKEAIVVSSLGICSVLRFEGGAMVPGPKTLVLAH